MLTIYTKALIVGVMTLCLLASALAKTTGGSQQDDVDFSPFPQDVEVGTGLDDGSVETALLNYLFAKQIMARLRNNGNPHDLIKKRSYWKQCAFNAVSCFGK